LPLAVLVTMTITTATFSATGHRRSGYWLPNRRQGFPGEVQPRMKAMDEAGSTIFYT